MKWYDDNADNSAWLKALAEVRRLGPREGWCYQHVQAMESAVATRVTCPKLSVPG
jgi:hypothetical protein